MGNADRFHLAGAVAAAVLLAGCEDRQQTWSRSELEDIAADAQTVDVGALETRLDELQGEIDQLESENNSLESEADALRSELDNLEAEYRDHRHY